MGALTKKERDGLDEIFLSMKNHTNRYERFKQLSLLLMPHNSPINIKKLYKQAKYGLKETRISVFLSELIKKKKKLSK